MSGAPLILGDAVVCEVCRLPVDMFDLSGQPSDTLCSECQPFRFQLREEARHVVRHDAGGTNAAAAFKGDVARGGARDGDTAAQLGDEERRRVVRDGGTP